MDGRDGDLIALRDAPRRHARPARRSRDLLPRGSRRPPPRHRPPPLRPRRLAARVDPARDADGRVVAYRQVVNPGAPMPVDAEAATIDEFIPLLEDLSASTPTSRRRSDDPRSRPSIARPSSPRSAPRSTGTRVIGRRPTPGSGTSSPSRRTSKSPPNGSSRGRNRCPGRPACPPSRRCSCSAPSSREEAPTGRRSSRSRTASCPTSTPRPRSCGSSATSGTGATTRIARSSDGWRRTSDPCRRRRRSPNLRRPRSSRRGVCGTSAYWALKYLGQEARAEAALARSREKAAKTAPGK